MSDKSPEGSSQLFRCTVCGFEVRNPADEKELSEGFAAPIGACTVCDMQPVEDHAES